MPLIQFRRRERHCRLRLIRRLGWCYSQSRHRRHLRSNFRQKATENLLPLRHQLSRSYSTQKTPYRLHHHDLA
jgi:hypothetical protein